MNFNLDIKFKQFKLLLITIPELKSGYPALKQAAYSFRKINHYPSLSGKPCTDNHLSVQPPPSYPVEIKKHKINIYTLPDDQMPVYPSSSCEVIFAPKEPKMIRNKRVLRDK